MSQRVPSRGVGGGGDGPDLDRYVRIGDLITSKMIRARLGWKTRSSVAYAQDNQGFPAPVVTLSRTHVWVWTEIMQWCDESFVEYLGPGSVVPTDEVRKRLALNVEDLEYFGVSPELVVDDVAQWLWSDVETVWHLVANGATSPSYRDQVQARHKKR